MIRLKKPELCQSKILDDCIDNIIDSKRRQRLSNLKKEIVELSHSYDCLAEQGKLLGIKGKEISDSYANKGDLLFLYSSKFSKKGELARQYYDKIKLSAPNGKCPQCGQQLVSTLDHYLPKSQYPLLSVVQYNLVPCCYDCNRHKLSQSAKSHTKETMHPYYDDFDDEIWLRAAIIEGKDIAFDFYVCKPEKWSMEKFERVKNHFRVFQLNNIYKPYAAEWAVEESKSLSRLLKKTDKKTVEDDICDRMKDVQSTHKNTWKYAVYKAIFYSEWFWKEYLLML